MQPARPLDARALARAGMEALRTGDARAARQLFEQIGRAGRADAGVWLGLALACRSLKDETAKLAAIDKALALEPRNLRALIMKADHLAEVGDHRAASTFYSTAVKAAPAAGRLSPEMLAEVRRAQAMQERYSAEYVAHLHRQLAARGFDPDRSSRRFAQSLELLTGKKRIYRQEPLSYYFPELPQIQFYERRDFPWLDAIEAAAADIRAELLEILRDGRAFIPYVEGESNRPQQDYQGLLGNVGWSAFFLCKNGEIVPENAARCPRTMRALEHAPLTRIARRAPMILFSLLRPGVHIPPHTGYFNSRLICHLPLIVPDNCRLRVGNDTRYWQQDKAWVFDDTIEHEAWNGSDKVRVLLLFDIWRPELSAEERGLVQALFEAIAAGGG
ncbi:MAG: aspartyl/asparaginyl beta-hydroxylase domain-containing protein [Gammaproteobacteria bacterium]|nr:aspartyl/asparaginyl beta-hydroxylase domain-containing protein [Gammaproteobacteria bacterium]